MNQTWGLFFFFFSSFVFSTTVFYYWGQKLCFLQARQNKALWGFSKSPLHLQTAVALTKWKQTNKQSKTNKHSENKQTNWKQTSKLKTNKQTKSVSPQKRICAKLLFFLILLMDQFSQSDNIWCGQNSSSLASFAKVILARYEAVFCWCSRYYSVAALVSRFPMEGEGGSSWRLWSDC